MATVKDLVTTYLAWVGQHRSANTLRFYRGRLNAFTAAFGGRDFVSLTPFEIETYLLRVNAWPDGRLKAPDTIRANVIALEEVQKFAIKNKVIDKQIFSDLEKPVGRQRERLPTPEEVEAIKKHSNAAFNLIYQALRQSGARPNELARATVADWDRNKNMIVLTQHKTAKKTGRPRKIAVGAKMQSLIEQSLASRRCQLSVVSPTSKLSVVGNADAAGGVSTLTTDNLAPAPQPTTPSTTPLFVSITGKPWTTGTLSTSFRRARNAAGLDKDIVLYSARHEHATNICKKLGLQAAAEALGHASINTTRRYAHTTPEELRDNQDAVDL